jgi:hypothetical protein
MLSIETRGTPYERGVQHGTQCAGLIRNVLDGYNKQGKLSFDYLPALQKIECVFPVVQEEMEGIADGAQVTCEEIFQLNLQQLEAAPACSVVAVRDKEGSAWLAKTDDIAASELGWNVLQHSTTTEGISSLMLHFAGTIWVSTAYVETGFYMAMTGLPGEAGPPVGIPWVALLPLLPSCCRTTDEALAVLEKTEIEYGGFSLLLADAGHKTVLVEKTSAGQASRELGWDDTEAALCQTNHCYLDTLSDPVDFKETPLARNSRARLEVISALASQVASGKSDTDEGLKNLLRDHTIPGGPCQHGDPYHPGRGLYTDYAVVLSPSLKGIWLAPGPACSNPFEFHPIASNDYHHASTLDRSICNS